MHFWKNVAVIEEDANEADDNDEHSIAASIDENVATENVETLDEDSNQFIAILYSVWWHVSLLPETK